MKYLHTEQSAIDVLQPFPGNARVHDLAALAESVRENGQYRAIVARPLPGGALQVLAGHGTLRAFAEAGVSTVRVEVIDADDREARRIVLADNATSRNASYDEQLLLDLLDAASVDGGLMGTSWGNDEYEALLAAVAPDVVADPAGQDAPDEFTSYDDETIQTEHTCPRCGYEYSGQGA